MFPKHVGTAFEENFRAAMEQREIRRFEVRGEYTNAWYNMTVFPSGEGITLLGTDITEHKQAMEALKASEEILRLMVNQATEAMVVLDSDGVIEAVSESGARLLGYDDGELVGKRASDLAVTFSRLEATLTLNELRKTAPESKTVCARIKTKTGEAQLMSLTVRLLNVGTKAEKYFVKFSNLDFPSARKPSRSDALFQKGVS